MISALASMTGAAVLCACAAAPTTPLPPLNSELPPPLRATSSQRLEDVLKASGNVEYVCRGAVHNLQWTQTGIVATLLDTGNRRVGFIAPGGYVVADDNSYVIGKVDASVQISAQDLAWSRLVARYTADGGGFAIPGRFSRTSMLQIVQTAGGIAPSLPCVAPGEARSIPFSATVMSYRNAAGNPDVGLED